MTDSTAAPPDPLGISIVIVNWNAREELDSCLQSLEDQHEQRFELVVVDNGSKDGSRELVHSRYPRAKLVDTGENLGFAEGCNRGIAASTQPWVLTLNNDAVADPHLVEVLRREAKLAADRVGMIQCRILFKQRPDRTNSTGILLFANGTAMDRDFDVPARRDDRVEEIFCPTAGAALYRRAMLDEIALPTGVFDGTYFMYFEDVDLGWRARLAGWSAIYAPDAIVHHAFQASSKKHGHDFVGLQVRKNRLRTLVKNGSPALLARSLPRSVVEVVELVAWTGPSGTVDLVRMLKGAIDARVDVERVRRVERRAVERQWIAKKPRTRGRA
jgi:GT2 family glycosyltransferase